MPLQQPNLFRYATSELSQDAVICYMLEWAKKQYKEIDEKMHNVCKDFLLSLFAKCNIQLENYNDLEIFKQEEYIDILCVVDSSDSRYYIIIEDKVFSSDHSRQLERYFENIKYRGIEDNHILRIYYKTGEEYQKEKIKNKGFEIYEKQDILAVIPKDFHNNVLSEYRSYIENLQLLSDYKEQSIEMWDTNAWIRFVNEEMIKIEDIKLGNKITAGRGQNSGIFYQYEKISHLGVALYLRLAFEDGEIQFKLENEGCQPTTQLGIKIFEKIEQAFVAAQSDLSLVRVCKKGGKTMTIAKILEVIKTDKNEKINLQLTLDAIKDIIDVHKSVLKSIIEEKN